MNCNQFFPEIFPLIRDFIQLYFRSIYLKHFQLPCKTDTLDRLKNSCLFCRLAVLSSLRTAKGKRTCSRTSCPSREERKL